jgi:hypothetical protein
MSTVSKICTLREKYIEFASQDTFLRKIIVYMVNHRVQDFADPLTSTLVLMATSPMQMVCCESGILPFKTSLLPVIPYGLLSFKENTFLQNIISQLPDEVMHETMESSGQYTLSVFHTLSSKVLLCKRQLLLNFAFVMFHNNNVYGDVAICKTLCNIILQRFMARVPVPSDMVSTVVQSFSNIELPTDVIVQRPEHIIQPLSELEIMSEKENDEDDAEDEDDEESLAVKKALESSLMLAPLPVAKALDKDILLSLSASTPELPQERRVKQKRK